MSEYCIGYASLVNESSARSSVPNLSEFNIGILRGYRRIFGKVSPQCVIRGTADWKTNEVSASFIHPDNNAPDMYVCHFKVPDQFWPVIRDRELDYRETVEDVKILKTGEIKRGHVYVGYDSHEDLINERGHAIYDHWHDYVKKYKGENYRRDILPSRHYLRLCLSAYLSLGKEYIDNFIETSFLSDRTTPLSSHLKALDWNPYDEERWA